MTHGPAQERTAQIRARGAERDHASHLAATKLAFVLFRDIRVRVAHGGSFAQERSKVATHGPAQERTARVRARGAERNHATYTACVRECMVVC